LWQDVEKAAKFAGFSFFDRRHGYHRDGMNYGKTT
jgi:hypothetical protein